MRRFIATFAFVGRVPGAPGTAASLVVAVLAGLWLDHPAAPWLLGAMAIVLLAAGVRVGNRALEDFGDKDPKQFVLDEAVGQAVACLGCLPVWQASWNPWINIAAAFVLFRLLDIVKPPPIRQAERLPGGWGIMADDLIAGIVAGAVVAAVNLAYRSGT